MSTTKFFVPVLNPVLLIESITSAISSLDLCNMYTVDMKKYASVSVRLLSRTVTVIWLRSVNSNGKLEFISREFAAQ
jgi:hypothetical protein